MSNTLDEMTMLLGEMVRKEKEAQPVALRVLDVRLEYAAKIQALITEARIDEVQNILNIRTPTNGTTTIKKKAENRLTQLKKDLSKS